MRFVVVCFLAISFFNPAAAQIEVQKSGKPVIATHYFGVTTQEEMEKIIADSISDSGGPATGALFDFSGWRYYYQPGEETAVLDLYVRKAYKEQQFRVFAFCVTTDVLFSELPPREEKIENAQIRRDRDMQGLEYVVRVPRTLYFPGFYRVFLVDARTGWWAAVSIRRGDVR